MTLAKITLYPNQSILYWDQKSRYISASVQIYLDLTNKEAIPLHFITSISLLRNQFVKPIAIDVLKHVTTQPRLQYKCEPLWISRALPGVHYCGFNITIGSASAFASARRYVNSEEKTRCVSNSVCSSFEYKRTIVRNCSSIEICSLLLKLTIC